MKKKGLPLQVIDEATFSLKEICDVCQVQNEIVIEMVQFGILQPQGKNPESWQFSPEQLNRSKRALRLQHDLEINLQGIALTLDLLDQLEDLRNEVLRMRQLLRSFNLD